MRQAFLVEMSHNKKYGYQNYHLINLRRVSRREMSPEDTPPRQIRRLAVTTSGKKTPYSDERLMQKQKRRKIVRYRQKTYLPYPEFGKGKYADKLQEKRPQKRASGCDKSLIYKKWAQLSFIFK